MDRTSKAQSAAPEAPASSPATPPVPEGENYEIHGQIVDFQSGGGGYDWAPGYTSYLIAAPDGRREWRTLSTYQQMKYPCYPCRVTSPAMQASSYGRLDWVLVTSLHDHYVVRALAEKFRA